MNDDDAPSIVPADEDYKRALLFFEIRAARLRLALKENDLAWLQTAVASGHVSVDGAIRVFNDIMTDEEDA